VCACIYDLVTSSSLLFTLLYYLLVVLHVCAVSKSCCKTIFQDKPVNVSKTAVEHRPIVWSCLLVTTVSFSWMSCRPTNLRIAPYRFWIELDLICLEFVTPAWRNGCWGSSAQWACECGASLSPTGVCYHCFTDWPLWGGEQYVHLHIYVAAGV